jgi:hypothetical protein
MPKKGVREIAPLFCCFLWFKIFKTYKRLDNYPMRYARNLSFACSEDEPKAIVADENKATETRKFFP